MALVVLLALGGVSSGAFAGPDDKPGARRGSQRSDTPVALVVRAGSADLRRRLGAPLDRALAARLPGVRVLRGRRLRVRLEADRQTAARLRRARALVDRAERAALQMDRARADDQAERALAALDALGGAAADPAIAARIQVVHALALLLEPAAPRRARRAFREALDADPQLRSDPRLMSPRVARQLERARRLPSLLRPTERTQLERFARACRLERVAALTATGSPEAGSTLLTVAAYDAERKRVVRSRAKLAGDEVDRTAVRAADLLAEALGSLQPVAARSVQPATAAAGPPAAAPAVGSTGALVRRSPSPGQARVSRSTPWYRSWWFWTVVGSAALVGGGVGLAVWLTTRDDTQPAPPGFDVKLNF